ncbi:microneme protein 5 [Cyclospora cayetanensis]|uniref:Microneme protein 5 n=1 Tax=Cyclospora cayetanensis TaxID=88456 RepID=A0A1D3D4P8_9EIME|nr:microneme protein 5 [Cyclospora cayetanensis]
MPSAMRNFKGLTVLATMVAALSNQKRTEAWVVPNRHDGNGDQSFNAQSLVETQWGSTYTHVNGVMSTDGSMVYIFETLAGEEKAFEVELGSQNKCAALGTVVDIEKSVVTDKYSNVSSADMCQELCTQTRTCVAAAFDQENSTCSMLSRVQGLTKGLSTLVVPSCNSDCFQTGWRIKGEGNLLGTTPNAHICQAMSGSGIAARGPSKQLIMQDLARK